MSAQLAQALRRIADWSECSPGYRRDLGSNCERDYYRKIAREALAAFEAAPQQEVWDAINKVQAKHLGLIKAAVDLIAQCHEQLETMPAPQCYGVPYGAVNALREALEAAPQQAQAPIDPDGEQSRAGFRAFDEAQMAQWATPWQVWREAVKWAAQQAQATGWQLVPVEPTPGLLMSMALRFDHGLGCPGYYDPFPRFPGDSHQKRLEGVLRQMRQIYEEISGAGFYRPELEESYKAMAAPQQGSKS